MPEVATGTLSPHDTQLVALLRSPQDVGAADARVLLESAERHGITDVVFDLLERHGAVPPDLRTELELRRVARELDHAAHLATLHRIDAALFDARLDAVVLKGPLFAERFYPRPSARATSDIDLLVAERDLEAATAALGAAGYAASTDPREAWWRAEHHHTHLESPHGLPLEMHFHAYRGFGTTLRSERLVARGAVVTRPEMKTLRVLAPEDEVVYLAVHAAAHRFERLGWLYDLVLLVGTMPDRSLERAAQVANGLGYARALAFAAHLLATHFGLERAVLLGRLGGLRRPLATHTFRAPSGAILRSATRFLYSAALCDSPGATGRYLAHASVDRARRLLAGEA